MSKKLRAQEINGVAIGKCLKDRSPQIPQRDKIDFQLSIRERDDWTENQIKIIDQILSKQSQIIFINGPAGTSKTFCAVYCALKLLNQRSHSDILYVRSIIESASKSLGSLPGDPEMKLNPFLTPLYDKLDELLPSNEVNTLMKNARITGTAVNYLRGSHFNARVIIGDESQNFSFSEMVTLITRLGRYSKMILIGDHCQSDLNGRSGWMKMFDLFNDEESRKRGIYCFSLTSKDIVRSGLVGYIVDRIEAQKLSTIKNEPMFPAK